MRKSHATRALLLFIIHQYLSLLSLVFLLILLIISFLIYFFLVDQVIRWLPLFDSFSTKEKELSIVVCSILFHAVAPDLLDRVDLIQVPVASAAFGRDTIV